MRLYRIADHCFKVAFPRRQVKQLLLYKSNKSSSSLSHSRTTVSSISCLGQCVRPSSLSRVDRRIRVQSKGDLSSSSQPSSSHRARACETLPDERQRLSHNWIPSTHSRQKAFKQSTTSELLERYGFYSTAYAGVFHFLPLGIRILEKLQQLIRKHMRSVGASEVALSSLSSVDLWKKSGRHDLIRNELFHVQSARERRLLLSPTHEEEITQLVAKLVGTYKELPLRLYQISRKYRDEIRPRGGLLRAREFLMKDLYTFDTSADDALRTYQLVYQAYRDFFRELKLSVHPVGAEAGHMGGATNHEFQMKSSSGDDEIVSCTGCGTKINAELVGPSDIRKRQKIDPTVIQASTEARRLSSPSWEEAILNVEPIHSEPFLSADGLTLVIAVIAREDKTRAFNLKELNRIVKLDTSLKDPYRAFWNSIRSTKDEDLKYYRVIVLADIMVDCKGDWKFLTYSQQDAKGEWIPLWTDTIESPRSLVSVETGDSCNTQECLDAGREGTLRKERSVELAHTFNLGVRYSSMLDANVASPTAGIKGGAVTIPVHMGCHGIGLTRLIGAVADTHRDEYGLRWPRLMAPFEALIIRRRGYERATEELYDLLSSGTKPIDCVIDDRNRGVGERYEEALVIGYPLILDVGRSWAQDHSCNVTYRLPNTRHAEVLIHLDVLKDTLVNLLNKHSSA